MQLTDFELRIIKEALQSTDKADNQWASVVNQWKEDSSAEAAEKMRKAREEYYQETAKLHIIISKIFRDAADISE